GGGRAGLSRGWLIEEGHGGEHGGTDRHHFFFSSRRRHTRWPRDWSSDVCSSDLSSPMFSTRTCKYTHCRPTIVFASLMTPSRIMAMVRSSGNSASASTSSCPRHCWPCWSCVAL